MKIRLPSSRAGRLAVLSVLAIAAACSATPSTAPESAKAALERELSAIASSLGGGLAKPATGHMFDCSAAISPGRSFSWVADRTLHASPHTVEIVRNKVAPDLASRGWRVTDDSYGSVIRFRFAKDGSDLAITMKADGVGTIYVAGSTACS